MESDRREMDMVLGESGSYVAPLRAHWQPGAYWRAAPFLSLMEGKPPVVYRPATLLVATPWLLGAGCPRHDSRNRTVCSSASAPRSHNDDAARARGGWMERTSGR